MTHERIKDLYFEWLSDIVCKDIFSGGIRYEKLLYRLYSHPFYSAIARDKNRADDGINLRYRFERSHNMPLYKNNPCSVLEMMIALALRCEKNLMDNPKYGDRTGQWFWGMIASLGLRGMTDDKFDCEYVDKTIDRFLKREYSPNGKGGLFTLRHCDCDLRDVEIWVQLCWFLDEIL